MAATLHVLLLLALATLCAGVQLGDVTSSALTEGAAQAQRALDDDIAEIRTQLEKLDARQALAQVNPAVASLRKKKETQGKVVNALASELPHLVQLVQNPHRDPIAIVSQSVRLAGSVIGVIPGGQVAGPVIRLVGALFGDIFGASPQHRPALSAEDIRFEVDTVVRSHVWDVAARVRLDDALTELKVAFNNVQPWLRAFEDPRNNNRFTGFRTLSRRIMDGAAGFRSPLDVQEAIIRAQRAIQSGAQYRDEQLRALAEGGDPSGLFQHMCTSWDWGQGNRSSDGEPLPGTPCHLLLRPSNWDLNHFIRSGVSINEQGNIVWPNIPRWQDANGGVCNRCTCVEGWTERNINRRLRFNRRNSACVERADLLPACTRAYRAAEADSQRLASPAFFRDVITLHQNVVFGNILAFFLMEPYIPAADYENFYVNVFRVETNLRRAQHWGTGEPCTRNYWSLANQVQNRLPSTPEGRDRNDRTMWTNWCNVELTLLQRRPICSNQVRRDGTHPTPAEAFNWRDYNVVRYSESVAA